MNPLKKAGATHAKWKKGISATSLSPLLLNDPLLGNLVAFERNPAQWDKCTISRYNKVFEQTRFSDDVTTKVFTMMKESGGEEVDVEKNVEIPYAKHLAPIFASGESRPDVVVKHKQTGLAVLLVEIQSCRNYETAIIQTALYVLNQFRILRNVDINLKKWSAFLFPEPQKKASYVTQVNVEWLDDSLSFNISYNPLEKKNCKIQMKNVLQKQLKKLLEIARASSSSLPVPLTGIPLSSRSITFMSRVVGPSEGPANLEQLPSATSIVVADNQWVYKYITNLAEENSMRKLLQKSRSTKDRFLLPVDSVVVTSAKGFFKYCRLDAPMSRLEVRKCFHDYARSVSEALSCMHKDLKRAHCDVRLENVAFRKTKGGYEAVLIDLDRSGSVEDEPMSGAYGKSVMYEIPNEAEWSPAEEEDDDEEDDEEEDDEEVTGEEKVEEGGGEKAGGLAERAGRAPTNAMKDWRSKEDEKDEEDKEDEEDEEPAGEAEDEADKETVEEAAEEEVEEGKGDETGRLAERAGRASRFTNEMMDWRQLGILLSYCCQNCRKAEKPDYHQLKIYAKTKKDPYIAALLRGEEGNVEDLALACRRKRKGKEREGEKLPKWTINEVLSKRSA